MKFWATAIIISLFPAFVFSQNPEERATITLTGEAETNAPVDEAEILFSIELYEDSDEVFNDLLEIQTRVDKLILEKYKIDKNDYSRENFSRRPLFLNNEYKRKKFRIARGYRVVFDKPKKVDYLLKDLLENGVTNIEAVIPKSKDIEKYKLEAKKLAIEAAKKSAETVALIIGRKVGKVVEIEEIKPEFPAYGPFAGQSSANIIRNTPEALSSESGYGSIPIKSIFKATFELE